MVYMDDYLLISARPAFGTVYILSRLKVKIGEQVSIFTLSLDKIWYQKGKAAEINK